MGTADAALDELVDTEAAYVAELACLCALKRTLLKSCDAANVDAIFANVDALSGINTELLSALQGHEAPPEASALDRVATAFETLAPYLRAYALFCTQAITSQERVRTLRAANAVADDAMSEVEHATGLTIGSWLIKPVQRLCKYPLLLSALLKAAPAHPGLAQAARVIRASGRFQPALGGPTRVADRPFVWPPRRGRRQ